MLSQFGRWERGSLPTSDDIRGFVHRHEQEAADLQFKDAAVAADLNKLRVVLAENVSALANSPGGLFVIGIRTDTDAGTKEEVATRFEGTTEDLSSQRILSLLQGTVVEPPFTSAFLSGLVIRHFNVPEHPGERGCAILVPASDIGPHQVRVGKRAGAYLRATAKGLVPIRHFELQQLLRERQAVLRLELAELCKYQRTLHAGREAQCDFRLVLAVTNQGPGPVRDVRLVAHFPTVPSAQGRPPPQGHFHLPPASEWHPGPPSPGHTHTWHGFAAPALPEGVGTSYQHAIGLLPGDAGTVVEYCAAYEAVGDRGRSPVTALRFTTAYGDDGLWSEPEPDLAEISKEEIPDRVYFRYVEPEGATAQ